MDNQIIHSQVMDQLGKHLEYYRSCLQQAGEKLDIIIQEIRNEKFIQDETAMRAISTIKELSSLTEVISQNYEQVKLGEFPDCLKDAEAAYHKAMQSVQEKRQIALRFLSLYTNDSDVMELLSKEQTLLADNPFPDTDKHACFMSAFDVVNGREGYMNIQCLYNDFPAELLNALFSRKLKENQQKELMNTFTVPRQTEKNKKPENTSTDTQPVQPSLNPESDSRAEELKTNEIPKSMPVAAELINQLPNIEHSINAHEYITDCKQDPKDYPKYTIKQRNIDRSNAGLMIFKSFCHGNIKKYQMAFRRYGSLTVRLAMIAAGEDKLSVANSALLRLYNTGLVYKVTPENCEPYYMINDFIDIDAEDTNDSGIYAVPLPMMPSKKKPEDSIESYVRQFKCNFLEKIVEVIGISNIDFTHINELNSMFSIFMTLESAPVVFIYLAKTVYKDIDLCRNLYAGFMNSVSNPVTFYIVSRNESAAEGIRTMFMDFSEKINFEIRDLRIYTDNDIDTIISDMDALRRESTCDKTINESTSLPQDPVNSVLQESSADEISVDNHFEGAGTDVIEIKAPEGDSDTTGATKKTETAKQKTKKQKNKDSQHKIDTKPPCEPQRMISSTAAQPGVKEIKAKNLFQSMYQLVESNHLYAIFPYMLAEGFDKKSIYYQMTSYAANEPSIRHSYSSENLEKVFSEGMEQDNNRFLHTAAAIRVLCSSAGESDYGTGAVYNTAFGYAACANSNSLNSFLYEMSKFKKKERRGTWHFSGHTMRNAEYDANIKAAVQEAGKYYNEYIENYIRAEKSNPRYMFMVQAMFDRKSKLAQLLDAIRENDKTMAPLIRDEVSSCYIRDGFPVHPDNIDLGKIDQFIDGLWEEAGYAMRHQMKGTRLYGSLRKNIINKIIRIVETACHYILAVEMIEDAGDARSADIYRRNCKKWAELAQKSVSEIEKYERNKETAIGAHILSMVLRECEARFNGSWREESRKYFYIGFLQDENVLLNEDLLPDTSGKNRTIEGFTLKDRILRHVNANTTTSNKSAYLDRLHEILNSDTTEMHDYGSAKQICDYLESTGEPALNEERKELELIPSPSCMDYMLESFREDVELAQGYGMLDNADDRKEQIITDVQECYEKCKETHNYGFFYNLLERYRTQIEKDSSAREKAVEAMFQKITNPENGYEVLEKTKDRIKKMIELRNFTVAEDIICRIQSGESFDVTHDTGMDIDYLSDFNKNFSTYYRMTRLPQKAAMPDLLEKWFKSGKTIFNETNMKNLLDVLGFRVSQVYRVANKTEDTYEVRLAAPKSRKRSAYTHPIAAFGSEAEKNPFNVVCLYGNHSVQELFGALKNNGVSRNTIVLLNSKFSMAERHTIAKRMRMEFSDKAIIIVDRPLLMYLAANCHPAVIQQALMQLTIPYAFYQPYAPSSTSGIRIEVFNGRKRELDEIEAPNGANIIYGGRQLGKSALLKMAELEVDKNENKDRAILVDIRSLNIEESAYAVSSALVDRGLLPEGAECKDWDVLTRMIRKMLEKPDAPPYLLLMLDEADTFIEKCGECNYLPLARLKNIQEMPGNRFKFVIAGLRDVVRFSKDIALGNNSVLPQLNAITVKPFKYHEARTLIEEPLWYLGFRFNEKTEPLVNMILANTNYFPGLIQLYCAKLVDALKNHDYAGYDPMHTPPFELTERHIKKVLADESFVKEVRQKYFITLRLANDDYYYILALLLADLYMRNGTDGYSAEEVWELAFEFGVEKIAKLEISTVKGLIEEMCELNVLRKAVGFNEKYIFSRYNFYQMLGSSMSAVEDEIEKYME